MIKSQKDEKNDELKISNLNINNTLNTIIESQNEEDSNKSKYNDLDNKERKDEPKLVKRKSDSISEKSEQYTEKKDYDKDSDISSIYLKSNRYSGE